MPRAIDYFLPALFQGLGMGGQVYAQQLLTAREEERRRKEEEAREQRAFERERQLGREQRAYDVAAKESDQAFDEFLSLMNYQFQAALSEQTARQRERQQEITAEQQERMLGLKADYERARQEAVASLAPKKVSFADYNKQINLALEYYAQSLDPVNIGTGGATQLQTLAKFTWEAAGPMAQRLGIRHPPPPWEQAATQPEFTRIPIQQGPISTTLPGAERPTPALNLGDILTGVEGVNIGNLPPPRAQAGMEQLLGAGAQAATQGQDPYTPGDTEEIYMAKLREANIPRAEAARLMRVHFPNIQF